MKENNPKRVAISHISEWLEENPIKTPEGDPHDVWVFYPCNFHSKDVSRLNRQLGLHKVNKYGDRMRRKTSF